MRYVLAMITGLLAVSSFGGPVQAEPQPSHGAVEQEVGESPEALVCGGIVVCINHVLWCEPRTPNGGKPTVIGKC
jgi:hypothetical protein